MFPHHKLINSLQWIFSTTVLKRCISSLVIIYIINIFGSEELGSYRIFTNIIALLTTITTFSFPNFLIVDNSSQKLAVGLQFIVCSTLIFSLICFLGKGMIATGYQSPMLYNYFVWGFWLVIPESIKLMIKSLHKLEFNFKFLSLAEIVNVVCCAIFTLVALFFRQEFYFYVFGFYLGSVVELLIIAYPIRRELGIKLLNCLKFKYITALFNFLQSQYEFLSLSTITVSLNFFILEIPIFIFGLFYDPHFIGAYFFASQFFLVPISFLMRSLNEVLFPTLSQSLKTGLAPKIQKYVEITLIIIFPLVLIWGIILKQSIFFFAGATDQILMRSLIIYMTARIIFKMLMNPISSIPLIHQKPIYELFWSLLSTLLISGLIFIFQSQDFFSNFILYSITMAFCDFIFICIIYKMIKLSLTHLYLTLSKGILFNIPLLLILFFDNLNQTLFSISCLVIGVSLTILMIYQFEKKLFHECWNRFYASPMKESNL